MMHLNRVGGFRRMELISPLTLYAAAVELSKGYNLIAAAKEGFSPEALVTNADCEQVHILMGSLHNELLKLNCPAASESALKPAAFMKDNALTYGALARFMDEVDGRLRDEIKHTYAFSLTPLEAGFFNPAEPLLGQAVATNFESAAFDIEEAGKCHALGRSTAAVFHALRALEVGIKAVGHCLDIPEIEKPSQRNWGFILGEIKKRIDVKWPKEKDRESGDGELFETLHLLMSVIRVPRNKTMHPARKYTEQEADRLLRVIGDVMTAIAERCDECGEPKA